MSQAEIQAIFEKLEHIHERLGKLEVRWGALLGLGIGLGLVNMVAVLKGIL